jgi:hypothetical protein
MLISIFSLRKFYDGGISIIYEGAQNETFVRLVKEMNVDIIPLEDDGTNVFVRKTMLNHYSPYDTTMFLDADTLVVDNIDEYFDKIEEYTFCTGAFEDWTTTGRIKKRILGFKEQYPDYMEPAIAYGKATNTGIFGFTKDAEIFKEWSDVARTGHENNCSKIPDEVGCQILLPKYKHWLAPTEWGASGKFHQDLEGVKIVHYHGRKHVKDGAPLCYLWKQAFWEYYWETSRKDRGFLRNRKLGDRRFNRYIIEHHNDVTIVTAVCPKYIDKFESNYKLWMKTDGINSRPIICFINGFELGDERLSFMGNNVNRVKWDMPTADTHREEMLTAFILGVKGRVKTKYWVKLDGDVTPKFKDTPLGETLHLQDYQDYQVVAHKWGYTKPGKWICDLEEWAETVPELKGTDRLFTDKELEEALNQKRYGHPRFCSFICVHETAFVNQIAEIAGDRLPVPSHDTYLWYMADRMGKKVKRTKFKDRFAP